MNKALRVHSVIVCIVEVGNLRLFQPSDEALINFIIRGALRPAGGHPFFVGCLQVEIGQFRGLR